MRRLPWALLAIAVLTSTTGIVLLAQVPAAVIDRSGNSLTLQAVFAAILLVFGVVGAVVASRLPSNPVGWLFLALALLDATYELAYGYASYTLSADPGALPGAEWAAWVADWTSPLSPPFLVAAMVLFPDGRPPTPRWRWVLWLCGPIAGAVLMQYALAPGPLSEFSSLSNPAGLDGATWLRDVEAEPFYSIAIVAAAASLVVRFRRSHGVERQQVKWFAYAASLMAAFLIFGSLAQQAFDGSEDSIAAGFVFAACICGVPVATGIAILRHRLYDIDLVIRRTLVYGALSATLAAGYLGCVLLAQLVIGAQSDVAIALSTLAMAALFRPARARIQGIVDRRFYRGRYDAARTLEAFSARLREELDLDALAADVRGVVHDTVQPAHVSVWLRGER